jgi:UrcA family protein
MQTEGRVMTASDATAPTLTKAALMPIRNEQEEAMRSSDDPHAYGRAARDHHTLMTQDCPRAGNGFIMSRNLIINIVAICLLAVPAAVSAQPVVAPAVSLLGLTIKALQVGGQALAVDLTFVDPARKLLGFDQVPKLKAQLAEQKTQLLQMQQQMGTARVDKEKLGELVSTALQCASRDEELLKAIEANDRPAIYRLQTTLASLSKQLVALQHDVDSMSGTVSDLSEQMAGMLTTIEPLSERLAQLELQVVRLCAQAGRVCAEDPPPPAVPPEVSIIARKRAISDQVRTKSVQFDRSQLGDADVQRDLLAKLTSAAAEVCAPDTPQLYEHRQTDECRQHALDRAVTEVHNDGLTALYTRTRKP